MKTPENIASFAVSERTSMGRRFPEEAHRYRNAFERDRDRIIHCSAFRRLEGKTQVFTPGVNENYRTRLTHSIEVAQIGRTVAGVLRLNESLTEAICLGHDLGHSPFGHAGEKVLNELMADLGGFEHNRQALRIVDFIEHPYPDFAGLNLMYETRLGFARHHSPYDKPISDGFEEKVCSLEGQVADLADRIAYNCHDLEDGLRSQLIDEEQLKSIALFKKAQEKINSRRITDRVVRRTRTAKTIIDILVGDVIETGKRLLKKTHIVTVQDVYNRPGSLIRLSTTADRELQELEEFLLNNMYQHPTLEKAAEQVRVNLDRLFNKILVRPERMPRYYRDMIGEQGLERVVCDYIAGMTDRFCLAMLEGEGKR